MIKSLFKWYADLPFTARFIISFLIGATIGSAFLAFVSNYATYWYAFRHGARIPIEGIPFLSLSIAISGFLMFTISTLGVTALYILLGVSFNRKSKFEKLDGLQIALLLGAVCISVFLALLAQIYVFDHPWEIILPLMIAFYMGTATSILVSWRFRYINRILSILYLTLALIASGGMFVDGVYDTFLRWIRFGGGIEIALQRKDKPELKAYLFLYTQDRVILYDPAKSGFFEVPTIEVESYAYNQYPNWKLPDSSLREQGKYVRY